MRDTLRPRIFIGSAGTGVPVAEKLRNELLSWADCDIWAQSGVFELNKNYLDQLLEHLNLYDYSIMVATGADETTSKGVTKFSPRDNVVFELGLFMGRLGRDRAFYVFEEGAKLLSDLEGITLPQFPRRKGKAQDKAIAECAAKSKSILTTVLEFLKVAFSLRYR
jgi:predicted nucleotide-binding protein